MPYTGDPLNNEIDRIRLVVGDTDTSDEILPDAVYQYMLDIYPTEDRVALEAINAIMAQAARMAVRERVGAEEIFGQEYFDNLRVLKKDLETKISNSLDANGIYAGGISLADIADNNANPDNVPSRLTRGLSTQLTGSVFNTPRNPT